MKLYSLFILAGLLALVGCVQEDTQVFCTEEYAPVCGADGKTYSNACYADVAGVEIDYTGECQTQEQKNDSDSKNKTEVCATIYAPVCGEDNETYSNECFAELAGVGVSYAGECKTGKNELANPASTNCIEQNGTLTIVTENGGEVGYCHLPNGTICEEWSLFRGECAQLKPQDATVCTNEYIPVCGMDGKTYSNKCFIAAADVQIDHLGECEEQYICTREYVPVCGVDGITYPNGCVASSQGAEIDYVGECESQPKELTESMCVENGGTWNSCGSACRGEPEGTICTLQCVFYCECSNSEQCPQGYECTDYLLEGDEYIGVCKST